MDPGVLTVGAVPPAVEPDWRYSCGMPSIQVKDVPADVHAVLRRRAVMAGQSMQEYLLARFVDEARRPTLDEVLDRAAQRTGGTAGFVQAVKAIRADREAG